MKKVLLSFSLMACVYGASAQAISTGAFDDFNSVTEYGTAEGGIFWWADEKWPDDYEVTRDGEALQIVVTKPDPDPLSEPPYDGYTPVGFGFGDSNGPDPDGTPFTLDITGNKELKIKASATTEVRIDVQVEDINGVKVEIAATGAPDGSDNNKLGFTATPTLTEHTVDLTGARVVLNWSCTPWPANCPAIDEDATAAFDYANIAKVSFFISGGVAYDGTIVFDDMMFGNAPSTPGLVTGVNKAAELIAAARVYPNPASSDATVELSLKSASDVKVTLSDMMGREVAVVAEGKMTNLNKAFSTSELTKGLYTVNYFINGAPAKATLLMVK